MAIYKCKMCGGTIEFEKGDTVGVCDSCGTKQTLPKTNDDVISNLFNRANNLRLKCEFDKAVQIYEKIVEQDDSEAEAHWGIVLCKYGIEYVEDPKTFKRIPTCHRTLFEAVTTDADYLAAIDYSDATQQHIYESEARSIDRIQKDILAIVKNEKPFDVFICYKETDENGKRTIDSTIANDIYYQLTQEGFKVFFAAITLEDKLGQEYEPYIFAALNSAKVMLVLGTKPEYYSAVWVKNEWSRFLQLMKSDRSKLMIPCYRDMDAYDLPEEFAHLQAQDMSKLGFMQDLIRGIKKIIGSDEQKSSVRNIAVETGVNTDALLKRAFIFLEDRNWDNADGYFEKVLDSDPENAMAYLGKMMLQLRVARQKDLAELTTPFDDNGYFEKAIRYADPTLKNTLQGYIVTINERNEHNRLESAYQEATSMMESADDESDYIEAAEKFEAISDYLNSSELSSKCRELAKTAHDEAIYQAAYREETKEAIDMSSKVSALENAISKYKQILEYKDSTDRISKLNLDIEELNKKIEIARKHNKKIAIILSSAAAFVVVFLIVLFNVIIPAVKYSSANKCVEIKEYLEAIAIYEELADYKDSADKVISTRYLLASSQLENKEYQNAYDNFTLIKDYEDSAAKRQESGYGYAQALMTDKKYQEAIDIFGSIGDYEKSADLKNQCYLEVAKQFYANKEYYSALTWYEKVKSYDKNAEFYTDSCYNYAVQQINSGSYSTALTYLKKAGNHSGVNDQIKAAKYGYVKANKNNYDNTTFEYLKELKSAGYKDSASIYKELYAWKAEIIAINSDPEDEKTNKTSISVYDPVYFHIKVTGGEPGAEVTLTRKAIFPGGDTYKTKWDWAAHNGTITWVGWDTGIYQNPAYGTRGTLKLQIYDENGNMIGEDSVRMTS